MKILVLGGTRLLGHAVVKRLMRQGHALTVVSRRAQRLVPQVRGLALERTEGLRQLKGEHFDLTLDFLAYDGDSITSVFDGPDPGTYVLISSAWMVRLRPGMAADEPVDTVDPAASARLPTVTKGYLSGKLAAESVVLALRQSGRPVTLLRLPIFLDVHDHTGRVRFYVDRVCDGAPLIAIDGAFNHAQLVWCDDVAKAIERWCPMAVEHPIWEGLPPISLSVREVIGAIAKGRRRKHRLVDVSSDKIASALPELLDAEPLWRESATSLTGSNLFAAARMTPTPPNKWLAQVSAQIAPERPTTLRRRELDLLRASGLC